MRSWYAAGLGFLAGVLTVLGLWWWGQGSAPLPLTPQQVEKLREVGVAVPTIAEPTVVAETHEWSKPIVRKAKEIAPGTKVESATSADTGEVVIWQGTPSDNAPVIWNGTPGDSVVVGQRTVTCASRTKLEWVDLLLPDGTRGVSAHSKTWRTLPLPVELVDEHDLPARAIERVSSPPIVQQEALTLGLLFGLRDDPGGATPVLHAVAVLPRLGSSRFRPIVSFAKDLSCARDLVGNQMAACRRPFAVAAGIGASWSSTR